MQLAVNVASIIITQKVYLMKFRLILTLFSILMLSSCSKLNMENYDKLETGMKFDEVTGIIGAADSCDEKLGARSCIWVDSEGVYIKAKFLGETAVAFSHKNLK